MIYHHQVCNKTNMVGATSRTRTVTLPEHLSSNPVFIKVLVAQSVFVCICLVPGGDKS
jgi:hypothetical protein